MIYVVDEKDLTSALKTLLGENFVAGDEVYLFCKDMTKPCFTGEDVIGLMSLKDTANVNMQCISTREEQVFFIGGLAFSGAEVTLYNFSIPIPDSFKEKVHIVPLTGKRTTVKRGGRRKTAEVKVTEENSSDKSDESDNRQEVESESKE